MSNATIDEIWIYPVKSLGGVCLAKARVTAVGSLALDREWLVVDPAGQMIWQGDIPRMTLVSVALEPDAVILSMDGLQPLRVDRATEGVALPVTMYKRAFTGIDMGATAAEWLSDALGRPLRLVRIGDAAHRWDGLNPVHVVSDVSLAALNQELRERGDQSVSPMRFRPNIILRTDGAKPWFEEQTPVLDFGGARIVLREPCQRCELPNINLVDASREKQPLKLIGQLAKSRATAAPASFGTYATVEGTHIARGMRALVVEPSA